MRGRCLPENPTFKSDAERRVWEAVRRHLRDGDALLANIRFSGQRDGDWEVDLILLLAGAGFATIEVKGGHVWRDGGRWHQFTPSGTKELDLADQAVSERYLVRRFLAGRWSRGVPRMAHFVALPDEDLPRDADLGPDLPRSRVITKADLRHAAGLVWDVLDGRLDNEPAWRPGRDAVDEAADLLAGRGDPQRELSAMLAVREDHVARLTQQQYDVLAMARAIPRYQVVGGPGAGKTWLAMEQARRWATEGLRVAYLAYSRGLTTWVRRAVEDWPRAARRRTQVATFHSLGHAWGAEPLDGAGQQHWDEEIPAQMEAQARGLDASQRFDAVVVDEAQDFGAAWWPAILAAYTDPETGRLAVYSDRAQRIFGRVGGDDLGLPVLTLDRNLRNSGPIGLAVNSLLPRSMRLLGGDGPAVVFRACTSSGAVAAADDEAVRLLDAGWRHGDIALLTTHHRHPMQVEAVDVHGRDGYWDLFWDDAELFYATVSGFKGLERRAVVLAVDGFRTPDVARETLLVGASRARDLLVVCGDPDQVRSVAGARGAGRLGIPNSAS